jgi:hypothetical protein
MASDDECEKGIRRSSRIKKNLPACTKRFSEGGLGEEVSEGGYASAGFAEAVKMPCAEARGASLPNFQDLKKRNRLQKMELRKIIVNEMTI